MGDYYLPLVLLLVLIAVFVQDDFVFTLLYLFVGAFLIVSWWSRRALERISYKRRFSKRAFPGEKVTVRLDFIHKGWLPIVWMQVVEGLPANLVGKDIFWKIISLGPKSKVQVTYTLRTNKRGYYRIGPLSLRSGDILGLLKEITKEGAPDYLTVYPRVVPLTQIVLPSQSPLGTLRRPQPIFEDPSRVIGKREYTVGDSLRRVDWKSTASVGRIQVKQLEPSIDLEIAIFLDLHLESYHYRQRIDSSELAIVTAASIANWVSTRRQAVGLFSNGVDPIEVDTKVPIVAPRKGRGHLMRILEILARVELSDEQTFIDLLQQGRMRLSWGTTLVLVSGKADHDLFDEVFKASRVGLNSVLIMCGQVPGLKMIKNQTKHFGIPFHHFLNIRDLEMWH